MAGRENLVQQSPLMEASLGVRMSRLGLVTASIRRCYGRPYGEKLGLSQNTHTRIRSMMRSKQPERGEHSLFQEYTFTSVTVVIWPIFVGLSSDFVSDIS